MESSKGTRSSIRPTARLEVENMHGYTAPLEGRRKLLRLDFNENTIGPSPLVIQALKNIPASHIAIYPEYSGLKEAFIANLDYPGTAIKVIPAQVEAFNGVDAAIHAIFQSYGDKNDRLLIASPTFGYYTPCAHMQGMKVTSIPYEGVDFKFPSEKILLALEEKPHKLLIICNPNNPTGSRLSPERIIEIATKAPQTLIVVDELYEAFTGDSVLPKIDFTNTPNIVVLRSLSKTAGLAGLRIGFAIGNQEVIKIIKRVTGPYDINNMAVIGALAALKDQAYIDNYVAEVIKAKNWIKGKLISNKIRHHIDGGNYFLLWPKYNSNDIESSFKSLGILVRNMKGKPLISESIRVSIGTREQMHAFWEAFKKIENF